MMADAIEQGSEKEVNRLRRRVARLEQERAEWIRARDGLRESEAKLRTLVECLGEGVNIVDGNQCFIFANSAAEEIFGVEPGGLLGRYLAEFAPSDASTVIQHQVDVRRMGRTTTYHLQIVRPDEQRRQLLVTGSPSFSVDGKFAGAFAVFRDITDRMNMESALRVSLQRLSRVEHVARIGFFDWNIRTGEIDVSDGANRLFELSPDEKLVSPDIFKQVVHPDDFELVQQALDVAAQGIKPFEIDFRLAPSGGRVVWVRAQAELTRDSAGTAVRLLGTLVDISDRMRAQHQLKHAFDQLERRVEERTHDLRIANDTLAREIDNRKHIEEQARKYREEFAHVSRLSTMGEMATGIAHELNQPLCAISNFAFAGREALRREESPEAEHLRNIFQALSEQAIRAGNIVGWLRGFVNKTSSQMATVELNRIIAEVANFMEPELRLNHTRLAINLANTVTSVSIDTIQIQQVVVNLIRNAVDAMSSTDKSQRELTITTSNSKCQMAEVTVRDNGEGIPTEQLEEVFQTFYTTKDAGMGMGLAISRSIIEDHGGRLWVEQNSNRGVTFRFTIPFERKYDNAGQ